MILKDSILKQCTTKIFDKIPHQRTPRGEINNEKTDQSLKIPFAFSQYSSIFSKERSSREISSSKAKVSIN